MERGDLKNSYFFLHFSTNVDQKEEEEGWAAGRYSRIGYPGPDVYEHFHGRLITAARRFNPCNRTKNTSYFTETTQIFPVRSVFVQPAFVQLFSSNPFRPILLG